MPSTSSWSTCRHKRQLTLYQSVWLLTIQYGYWLRSAGPSTPYGSVAFALRAWPQCPICLTVTDHLTPNPEPPRAQEVPTLPGSGQAYFSLIIAISSGHDPRLIFPPLTAMVSLFISAYCRVSCILAATSSHFSSSNACLQALEWPGQTWM